MLLRVAFVSFMLALVAGVLGFFGLARGVEAIARTLFFVFLMGFLLTFVAGLLTGNNRTA